MTTADAELEYDDDEEWLECPNCGRLPPNPDGRYYAEDDDSESDDVCRCELCDVCGEDTRGGMVLCKCERAAAGSGPAV